MLPIVLILFLASGALVALGTVSLGRCKQRLALVAAEVNQEVDGILRKAQEQDHLLSKHLADGKPTIQSIEEWQTGVAGLVSLGKTGRPWAWTADDLKDWARQRIAGRSDEIKRSHLISLVISTVLIVLTSGGAALGWYQFLAAAKSAQGFSAGSAAFDAGASIPVAADDDWNLPAAQTSATP